jgi:hypothetical protein
MIEPTLVATIPIMGHYRFIPEQQKSLIITMLDRGQTPVAVENATGINVRTIQQVRKLWLSTGRVTKRPLEEGRQQILTSLKVSVSDYFLASGQDCKISTMLSYSFSRALLSSSQIYTSKSCNMHCLLCMTLKCPSALLTKPYEIAALQGKR